MPINRLGAQIVAIPPATQFNDEGRALSTGQQGSVLHPKGTGELPQSPKRDRATRLDALVVPEAEAALHHVLLREAASRSELPDPQAQAAAKSLKVCLGHDGQTLRG